MNEQFVEGTSRFGTFYPTHYVIGVVDSRDRANQAAGALTRAGFAPEHIQTSTASDMARRRQEFIAGLSFAEKMTAKLGNILASDEKTAEEQYRDRAEDGGILIAVYAPKGDDARRAATALAEHDAYDIRYYRDNLVEEMPTRPERRGP